MATASLIISILSLILSVFIFIRFEYRIKKQQIELNDYALKEYKAKEDAKDKGELIAYAKLVNGHRGNITLSNIGLSSAKKISIKVSKGKNEKFKGVEIPELVAGGKINFPYYIFSQDTEELEIEIVWSDKNSENKSKKQILNMLEK